MGSPVFYYTTSYFVFYLSPTTPLLSISSTYACDDFSSRGEIYFSISSGPGPASTGYSSIWLDKLEFYF